MRSISQRALHHKGTCAVLYAQKHVQSAYRAFACLSKAIWWSRNAFKKKYLPGADTPGVHLAHRLPHLLGPELARALHPRGPLRAFRAPMPAQLAACARCGACTTYCSMSCQPFKQGQGSGWWMARLRLLTPDAPGSVQFIDLGPPRVA